MKKKLVCVVLLLWQCQMILGKPGVVDSPEIRKRAINTKLSSYNSIGSSGDEKLSNSIFGTTEPVQAEFEPMKITHEDVVRGSNAVYGSQSPFTSGGIIFAIGQPSTPLAHPQPVLLQYLTPEGKPKQTAVQYVQLLRPLMIVPPQPYHPSTSVDIQTETSKSIFNPYGSPPSSSFNSLIGAHSAPLSSYVTSTTKSPTTTQTEVDINLNTNEYIPAASSRISSSFVAPQVAQMTGFTPSKFPMISQRA